MAFDIGAMVAPLFVPGDRPERIAKAAASGADAVVVDLEDSVSPQAKAAARANLASLPDLAVPLIVRVNAVGTPWHDDDLAALGGAPVSAVILPKAEQAKDTSALREALGGVALIALIETARGLAAARDIAASGTARLAFGSIDFCADIGAAHTQEALIFARSELVLASRLANLPGPLDGVTAAFDDAESLARDVRHARDLGLTGKLCIHPGQIQSVLAGFAPSEAEVAWATRVVAGGVGGAQAVDGAMIDAPVRAMAERVLVRAAAAQARSSRPAS